MGSKNFSGGVFALCVIISKRLICGGKGSFYHNMDPLLLQSWHSEVKHKQNKNLCYRKLHELMDEIFHESKIGDWKRGCPTPLLKTDAK